MLSSWIRTTITAGRSSLCSTSTERATSPGPTPSRSATGGTTATGNLTGTYSVNPDGTGTATVSIDVGYTSTFALVVTDGEKAIRRYRTSTASD